MEAILRAAEKEFALQGYDGTSVREIAARAGVTHALVHRYFGKKAALHRTVLAHNGNVIADAAAGVDDLTQAAILMLHEGLERHRDYLRLLVSSSLRGIPFDRSVASFAATDRLMELARSSAGEGAHPPEGDDEMRADVDRRLAIAIAVALFLGWVAIEPWLLKATDLEDLGDEAIRGGLERATRILFEGWPLVPAAAGTAD